MEGKDVKAGNGIRGTAGKGGGGTVAPVDFSGALRALHRQGLLEALLLDRTTGTPITWATDAYRELGLGFMARDPITPARLLAPSPFVLRPRAAKPAADRAGRTKSHAEVSTPLWVCNRMVDALGLPPEGTEGLVEARCLEVACGEAPFLVQRHDPETGAAVPPGERRGVLDRKLRAVMEMAENANVFCNLARRAVRSTYAFELQGDSLLIARLSALLAVEEAFRARFGRGLSKRQLAPVVAAVGWNFFQMDALSGRVPVLAEWLPGGQMALFDIDNFALQPPDPPDPAPALFDIDAVAPAGEPPPDPRPYALVADWRGHSFPLFAPGQPKEPPMKFDYIVGNPPYQDEALGDNATFAPPIYHKFLDESFKVGKSVVLVHPARFLFDAGATPHEWNRKMLADPHFKVLQYEQDASAFFPNTEIKGGVAISCHDAGKDYGAIEIFTPFPELNGILHKVKARNFESFGKIVFTAYAYHLTPKLHQDHPDAAGQLSRGHAFDIKSNTLERLPGIFLTNRPDDNQAYVRIYGRVGTERVYRFVRRDYVNRPRNLDKWKVFVPKSNGSFGFDVLASPIVAPPEVGHTETFMSIGRFDTEGEAQACLKYVCTKFARAMLGVLKVTQDNPPEKWKYVPLQDFTPDSDIDWGAGVGEIDRRLYGKYGLTEGEIAFVESRVRGME